MSSGLRKFPGISVTKPVVGRLRLIAVKDPLGKYPVFVSYPVPITGVVERRH